ncbi:MAG: VF530 family protein [Gemmatimonadaceae bacterium]
MDESVDKARTPDPLHGVTLQMMLEHLEERYGWEGLAERITVRCFTHDPSVKSSLKFLRKTPWARAKVESLYVHSITHPRKTPRVAPEG